MSWTSLIPFFSWLVATPFGSWIGASALRVALLFTTHLFGLVLLLGSVVILSLRLLGLTLGKIPLRDLGRIGFPLSVAGLLIMVASGILLFIGGAEDYYIGYWFRLKMVLLFFAVIFHFSFFKKVTREEWTTMGSASRLVVERIAAVSALLLWFAVGWAGRAIAFF